MLGLVFFFTSSFLSRHRISVGFVYDILHYYIFISLGNLLSEVILDERKRRIYGSWILFAAILPFFVLCQWYFLQTNLAHANYSFVEDFQPFLFLIIALSGCAFMMNISFILQRYKVLLTLRVIGFYSLYIYLMHVLASSATRILFTRVFHLHNPPVLLVLGITAGLFIPVIFYNLAMDWGWWWLFSPVKEKKKNLVGGPGLPAVPEPAAIQNHAS
jgi:hypothetical protein